MYDIIIVGAGTAGLSAAIYGVRAGKTVLVLEAEAYGGQIINTPEIENYPAIAQISGFEFATNLYNQAKDLGAEIAFEKVEKVEDKGDIKQVFTNKGAHEAQTVIFATGAKNRPLGIDGEEALVGAGISYCATCDGAFYRGKVTAVAGGGNTALEDAIFLSSYCSKVYLIHRRDTFRGEQHLVNVLEKLENVEFLLNKTIESLNGDGKLSSVTIADKISGQVEEVAVDGLFVAIGQMPENKEFENLVALDGGGYIQGGEDCKTQTPGVFTAGDCRTKTVRQLATAAADGAVAALAACDYINTK